MSQKNEFYVDIDGELRLHLQAMKDQTRKGIQDSVKLWGEELFFGLKTVSDIVKNPSKRKELRKRKISEDDFFEHVENMYTANRESIHFDFSPFESGLDGLDKLFEKQKISSIISTVFEKDNIIYDNSTTVIEKFRHLAAFHMFYWGLNTSEKMSGTDLAFMLRIDRLTWKLLQDVACSVALAKSERVTTARTTSSNALSKFKTEDIQVVINEILVSLLSNSKKKYKDLRGLAKDIRNEMIIRANGDANKTRETDTIEKYLRSEYNFTKLNFSEEIKLVVKELGRSDCVT